MIHGVMIAILLLIAPVYINAQEPPSNIVDEGGHEQWEYWLEGSGDVLQLAIPLSGAAISLIKEDYEGTKQLAFSYGSALALTYTLKHLIHKQRPEGRDRYDSFPSGHTTSAFAGAAFIQQRYGWKYGWVAYTLATLVGISRMEGPDGYHDIWDVLAGASIGISSNILFTRPYPDRPLDIGFRSGNGNYLLTFVYRF